MVKFTANEKKLNGGGGGGETLLVLTRREDEGHGLALASNPLISTYMRRKDRLRERKKGALGGQVLLFKNTKPLAIFRQTS